MGRVIEYVGARGVRSSDCDQYRLTRPKPGDVIEWPNGKLGRVREVGDGFVKPYEVHACAELGSVFLKLDNKGRGSTVDISGGPFLVVDRADLEPTYRMETVRFWNWGDGRPGADQGVDYYLQRPVFRYVGESNHYAIRKGEE